MNIEALRSFCKKLPAVTEDIKWGHDLCFLIAGKMFCVTSLEPPFTISFEVKADEFDELSSSSEIIPPLYMARNKWIQVQAESRFSKKEWEHYIKQSYNLKKAKLTKKLLKEHNLL
ncbi:MAG: MmcQ/YjbR family DNA-binding protein [Bacteroidia bacterium]